MLPPSLYRRLPSFLPTIQASAAARPLSTTSRSRKDTRIDESSGKGVKSSMKDHINKTTDTSNEYIDQAKQGKQAKKNGTADTRADPGGMTKKAEKEHPEAPKPIIGMKEERGKVSGCLS